MQRALIQYRNPANYELVKEALLKAHRSDLIGFDAKCLIRPRPDKNRQNYQGTDKNRRGQDDRNMGGKNAGRKIQETAAIKMDEILQKSVRQAKEDNPQHA